MLTAQVFAVDVDVKFIATIVQPTCDMSVIPYGGSNISNAGTNAYKLTIPDIRLDQLRAKGAES
ncbi:hypothetical protein AC26_0167 [Escherichia coli 1-176-05_S3_C2]|nr:hypothetical protein AC26_0167 [Escherichia coli 1-176-05_S3_C2]